MDSDDRHQLESQSQIQTHPPTQHDVSEATAAPPHRDEATASATATSTIGPPTVEHDPASRLTVPAASTPDPYAPLSPLSPFSPGPRPGPALASPMSPLSPLSPTGGLLGALKRSAAVSPTQEEHGPTTPQVHPLELEGGITGEGVRKGWKWHRWVRRGVARVLKYRTQLNTFLNVPQSSRAAFLCNVIMMVCIVVSVFTLLLETMPLHTEVAYPTTDMQLRPMSARAYNRLMKGSEVFFTVIFSAEFLLRLVAAEKVFAGSPGRNSGTTGSGGTGGNTDSTGAESTDNVSAGGRRRSTGSGDQQDNASLASSIGSGGPLSPKSALSLTSAQEASNAKSAQAAHQDSLIPFTHDVYNWLDFISVLPFYLEKMLGAQAQTHEEFLATLRLLRVLRIFKICRRFDGTEVLLEAVHRVVRPLTLPIFFFCVFSFVFGAFIYFLEPCYNYDSCEFTSVFSGMYFSIVTMTTVGYGDQVPGLFESRFLAVVIMIFGSIFLSMPLSVIGTEFDAVWAEHAQRLKDALALKKEDEEVGYKLLRKFLSKRSGRNKGSILDVVKAKQASAGPSDSAASPGGTTPESPALSTRVSGGGSGGLKPPAPRRLGGVLKAANGSGGNTGDSNCNNSVGSGVRGVSTNTGTITNASGLLPRSLRGGGAGGATGLRKKPDISRAMKKVPIKEKGPIPAARFSLVAEYVRITQTYSQMRRLLTMAQSGEMQPHHLEELVLWASKGASMKYALVQTIQDYCKLFDPKTKDASTFLKGLKSKTLLKKFSLKAKTPKKALTATASNAHTTTSTAATAPAGTGATGSSLSAAQALEPSQPLPRSTPSPTTGSRLIAPSPHAPSSRASTGGGLGGDVGSIPGSPPRPSWRASRMSLTNRTSMTLQRAVTAAHDILSLAGEETQVQHARESRSLKDRIWLALEHPNSSVPARMLNLILMASIILSVAMFGFQSEGRFIYYGEDSTKCADVVRTYCAHWVHTDWNDPTAGDGEASPSPSSNAGWENVRVADPGCFVWNGTHTQFGRPLKFGPRCTGDDCFGAGFNFGVHRAGEAFNASAFSEDSAVEASTHALTCMAGGLEAGLPRPFREQSDLPFHTAFANNANLLYDVCFRPECNNAHKLSVDLDPLWRALELAFAVVFTLELAARVWTARSRIGIFFDVFFIVDTCALLPFYVEIASLASADVGSYSHLSFSVSQTGGGFMKVVKIMKVFRIFKMTRHYSSVSILKETFKQSWRKLVIPFFMLFVFSMMLAVVFHLLESGYVCEVEGGTCEVSTWLGPRDITVDSEFEGMVVQVTLDGTLTSVPSSFEGLWLSLVTVTTVGYGRIFPITVGGKLVAVLAMVFGSCYLSMPLFIVGGSFYQCWRRHFEEEATKKQVETGDIGGSDENGGKEKEQKEMRKKVELGEGMSEGVRSYKEVAFKLDTLARELRQFQKGTQTPMGSIAEIDGNVGAAAAAAPSHHDRAVEYVLQQETALLELRQAHMQFAPHLRCIGLELREKGDFTHAAKKSSPFRF